MVSSFKVRTFSVGSQVTRVLLRDDGICTSSEFKRKPSNASSILCIEQIKAEKSVRKQHWKNYFVHITINCAEHVRYLERNSDQAMWGVSVAIASVFHPLTVNFWFLFLQISAINLEQF